MKTFKIISKLSNSTKIECMCGEIHNINNSKLENFKCETLALSDMSYVELKYYNDYKRRALRKGKEFSINHFEFKQLVYSKCFYCSSPPEYKKSLKYNMNGIDRVDNHKGYTSVNTITCCKVCNMMKRNYSLEYYLDHCKRVIEDNDSFKEIQKRKDTSEYLSFYVKRGALPSPVIAKDLIKSGYLSISDLKVNFLNYIKYRKDLSYDFEKVIGTRSLKGDIKIQRKEKINGKHIIVDFFKNLYNGIIN